MVRAWLRSAAAAFQMFSRLPAPRVDWQADNMRYMLAFLPLVGAVNGLLATGWLYLAQAAGFNGALSVAGVLTVSYLVTGGVHMDGFCDTLDALSAHQPPEKSRAILADPHVGAFAVMGCCLYMLLAFGLLCQIHWTPLRLLFYAVGLVLSRALGALLLLVLPSNKAEGLGALFKQSAQSGVRLALVLWLAIFALAAGALFAQAAVFWVLAILLFIVWFYHGVLPVFGGMSGDLAGFAIQVCELLTLAALVLGEVVSG